MEESEQAYAIVQRDSMGLFTWFRDAYKVSPFADGVVAVYRGTFDEIIPQAQDFEQANKGKPVRLLSNREIADLLK